MGYSIKRVDKNQPDIVKKFRSMGASVAHTHSVSQGFPDIVVGVKGLSLVGDFDVEKVLEAIANIEGIKVIENVSLIVEIKDDTQPPSKRKLTEDETKWHDSWKGQVAIVENEIEAENLLLDFSQNL